MTLLHAISIIRGDDNYDHSLATLQILGCLAAVTAQALRTVYGR